LQAEIVLIAYKTDVASGVRAPVVAPREVQRALGIRIFWFGLFVNTLSCTRKSQKKCEADENESIHEGVLQRKMKSYVDKNNPNLGNLLRKTYICTPKLLHHGRT